MTVQRVTVKVEFRIQRQHAAVCSQHQWIDLGEHRILFHEGAIQSLQAGAHLGERRHRNANVVSNRVGL